MNNILKKYSIIYLSLFTIFFVSCIGEDIINDRIDEVLTIKEVLDSLKIGETCQLEASYRNVVGEVLTPELTWVSSDETIMSITNNGLLEALTEGDVVITVSLKGRLDLSDTISVNSGMTTSKFNILERNGMLQTTSNYVLSGDFSIVDTGSGMGLELRMANNFIADSGLPGLYLYLTNNPLTNNGALEVSPITTFTGAQTFILPEEVKIEDYSHVLYYCKPFSVKVGDGKFSN